MEVVFESFLRSKMKNEKTVKGYLKDIKMLIEYLNEKNIEIENVREGDMKEYNLMLMEKEYSNNTIARKNSAFRMYFKFLRRNGKMTINPMEEIKQPELTQKYNEINDSLIETLLDIIDNERDKLMITLMYYEKIKPIEFLKLQKKDFEEKTDILMLEKRVVLLKEKSKHLMKEYIEKLEDPKDYLFLNQHNKNLSPSGVYFIIKKYLKEINKEEVRPIDFTKKDIKE